MNSLRTLVLSIIIGGCLIGTASATMVEAEGSAVIVDGNIGAARLAAYQNALRQASMMQGARINSLYSTNMDQQVLDSIQVRSSSHVSKADIISESIEGKTITLHIQAELQGSGDRCELTAGQYRKKVAATYFSLLDGADLSINDYYGFQRGIPTELLQRLSASGNFLVRDASHQSLHQDPLDYTTISGTGVPSRPLINNLLIKDGIQYVISGVIRDLGPEPPPSGPNSSVSANLGFEWKPRWRNLEIEFFIHDAYTGELMARHRYAKRARGEILPKQATRFGTRDFYRSTYGKLFEEVLEQETTAISKLLSCRPSIAKVLNLQKDHLYIDLGRDTKIEKGDTVTIYKSGIQGPVFGVEGSSHQFSEPDATITILQVYPGYSVAQFNEGEKLDLIAGEYLGVR